MLKVKEYFPLSLNLLRAHLYVGMQTAPKGFALLETHKDASLLDLDQVSLGWSLADSILSRNERRNGRWRYTIAR